jgi:prepilin-type N-terminal cleavage/methylation domain-containing protein
MVKNGFTLIEAMVVLCLVAIIATLGFVQLSFLDSIIVHAEADKIAAMCFYLRQKAIAKNIQYVLIFDAQNNEMRCDGICEKLSQRVAFGFIENALGPPGSPSHKIEKAITFPGNTIHFYPTGIISSGSVYLVDKKKKFMYALSNAVSQFSYLRVYHYDGKWKIIQQ